MKKISYALGLGIGQQLKSMNIENFDAKEFCRSIEDVMNGRETDFSAREAQVMLSEYFEKKQAEEAQANIAAGKAYLEENGKREGVITTKSGLQYEVLTEGTGKSPRPQIRYVATMRVVSLMVVCLTAHTSVANLPTLV
jgi:FKBP-type peptidyl-prolyl cis-trans isomerase FklB